MKNIVIFTEGLGMDKDKRFAVPIVPNGQLTFDSDGNPIVVGPNYDSFALLPKLTAPAIGYNPVTAYIGTSGVALTRSEVGGVNLKSQPTSPADNDYAMLIGVAATPTTTTFRAASPLRFEARVVLNQITLVVYGVGMDENITNPVPAATAGDGAAFYFDPAGEINTGGEAANWILTQKVNGTDTYLDSGVAVEANKTYDLAIQWGSDLKPKWYINGVLVGTSTVANTEGDTAKVNIGGQLNGTPAGVRADMDIRSYQLINGGLA